MDDLARWPNIVLEGDYQPEWIGPNVGAGASFVNEDGKLQQLPVEVTFAGHAYRIRIDGTDLSSKEASVAVRLKFDRFFVPKRLGLNDDVSELVVRKPNRIVLEK